MSEEHQKDKLHWNEKLILQNCEVRTATPQGLTKAFEHGNNLAKAVLEDEYRGNKWSMMNNSR